MHDQILKTSNGRSSGNSGKCSFDGQEIHNTILLDLPQKDVSGFCENGTLQTPPRLVLTKRPTDQFRIFRQQRFDLNSEYYVDGKSVEVG